MVWSEGEAALLGCRLTGPTVTVTPVVCEIASCLVFSSHSLSWITILTPSNRKYSGIPASFKSGYPVT